MRPPLPSRRRLLLSAAMCCAGLPAARAADYPDKPITVIVGFAPGGGVDGPLRLVTEKMRQALGVPIIIENRPGANQLVAIKRLMSAAPDGYTLYAGTGSSLGQNPAIHRNIGYDPLTDFSLIGRFAVSAAVLVVPAASPWKTLDDLVRHARKHPGELRYASAGVGSTSHLGLEVLARKLGFQAIHVPFRGDSPATVEIVEGRVDFGMPVSSTLAPHLAGGKLRLLAATSATPLPYAPAVPSLAAAAGPEMALLDPYTFYGLVGPKNLPPAVAQKLARALADAASSPDLMATYRGSFHAEPVSETPDQFRQFLARKLAGWAPYAGQFELGGH